MGIKYHAIIAVKRNSAIQGIARIFRRKFALPKLKDRRTLIAAIRSSQNHAACLQPSSLLNAVQLPLNVTAPTSCLTGLIVITEIEIQNYKSIDKLRLELGRVNVFIGENGAGKSNILEAIALAAAAAADKLDNEFLSSRGIRVTRPEWMRAGFDSANASAPIFIAFKAGEQHVRFELNNDNQPYSKWRGLDLKKLEIDEAERNASSELIKSEELYKKAIKDLSENQYLQSPKNQKSLTSIANTLLNNIYKKEVELSKKSILENLKKSNEISQFKSIKYPATKEQFSRFVTYSPENTSLRTFQREGQIEPLGVNGEGLLKLLGVLAETNFGVLNKIKERMRLLGWFGDFQVRASEADSRLDIIDRHLKDSKQFFDHRSANEGFFFLLFYFALFSTDLTPKFFAIDNIDASLNPKLCEKLTSELVQLSKENDKQVILTTHNPAVLDGLNLDDDEQRLFVISRDVDGATQVRRIAKPRSNGELVRLSELFLRGALGGLPKGF